MLSTNIYNPVYSAKQLFTLSGWKFAARNMVFIFSKWIFILSRIDVRSDEALLNRDEACRQAETKPPIFTCRKSWVGLIHMSVCMEVGSSCFHCFFRFYFLFQLFSVLIYKNKEKLFELRLSGPLSSIFPCLAHSFILWRELQRHSEEFREW